MSHSDLTRYGLYDSYMTQIWVWTAWLISYLYLTGLYDSYITQIWLDMDCNHNDSYLTRNGLYDISDSYLTTVDMERKPRIWPKSDYMTQNLTHIWLDMDIWLISDYMWDVRLIYDSDLNIYELSVHKQSHPHTCSQLIPRQPSAPQVKTYICRINSTCVEVLVHWMKSSYKPYKPLFGPYTDPETLNAGNGKGFRV